MRTYKRIFLPDLRNVTLEGYGVSRRCSSPGAAATDPSGWALTVGPKLNTVYVYIYEHIF